MSARELLTLNHPIHAVAWAIGMVTIALWIGWGFYFALVGTVKVLHTLVRARLENDPPEFRTGGLVSKGQHYVIGEMGPERIRPLPAARSRLPLRAP